jgi:hypothetical protein
VSASDAAAPHRAASALSAAVSAGGAPVALSCVNASNMRARKSDDVASSASRLTSTGSW